MNKRYENKNILCIFSMYW